jgi:hypothetical protein
MIVGGNEPFRETTFLVLVFFQLSVTRVRGVFSEYICQDTQYINLPQPRGAYQHARSS